MELPMLQKKSDIKGMVSKLFAMMALKKTIDPLFG
jgi:hypothetical protein